MNGLEGSRSVTQTAVGMPTPGEVCTILTHCFRNMPETFSNFREYRFREVAKVVPRDALLEICIAHAPVHTFLNALPFPNEQFRKIQDQCIKKIHSEPTAMISYLSQCGLPSNSKEHDVIIEIAKECINNQPVESLCSYLRHGIIRNMEARAAFLEWLCESPLREFRLNAEVLERLEAISGKHPEAWASFFIEYFIEIDPDFLIPENLMQKIMDGFDQPNIGVENYVIYLKFLEYSIVKNRLPLGMLNQKFANSEPAAIVFYLSQHGLPSNSQVRHAITEIVKNYVNCQPVESLCSYLTHGIRNIEARAAFLEWLCESQTAGSS